jgi:hypothetical protein
VGADGSRLYSVSSSLRVGGGVAVLSWRIFRGIGCFLLTVLPAFGNMMFPSFHSFFNSLGAWLKQGKLFRREFWYAG